jgi:hypothetical protein
MGWQYHAKRKGQVRLSKIKGDVCNCDYMWLRATAQGVEKMVTEFKGVQHSDESIYAEPHHYTVLSGHFKAPADLHRKRNLFTYSIGRWLTPELVWMFWTKNSFFHGDAIFVSSVVRPVMQSLERRRYRGPYHCLCMLTRASHLRGFVHKDVHCIPSAGEAT